MSSICPGLSIRPYKNGPGRRPSHLVATQPVAAVADFLTSKPAVLALLRRIDGIRGPCTTEIDDDPSMNELRSRQLARFYSGRGGYRVYVLSKGDMVLDELDRRARLAVTKTTVDESMLRLVEPDMKSAIARIDAIDGPVARRSRIRYEVA